MAKITATEWIRTVTPVLVLFVGGLVWGVRLEERHNALKSKVDDECKRSIAVDTAQDESQRATA